MCVCMCLKMCSFQLEFPRSQNPTATNKKKCRLKNIKTIMRLPRAIQATVRLLAPLLVLQIWVACNN